MGMILRIASSRIVGQGDIVGRSGYFSLNLSANSVMRGRLDARRTLKSLVADLRIELFLQHVGTGLPILTRKKSSILTLGCQLSDRQMDLLVELVQSHDIFDFADNSDVRSELCRLFKCDLDASIRVKNVRNVAVLFDAMAQYHLINNNWQYVMGEGRFLTSIKKDGTEKFITSSCLSSSLSRIRRNVSMTASQYAICKSIEQILREE